MRKPTRLILATILLGLLCISAIAQKGSLGFTVSNNTVGYPATGYPEIFYSQFHPGLELLYRYELNDAERHRFYAQMNLGVYYHRFVQTLVQLYPSAGYEYHFSEKWSAGASLGAGYGLSFEGANAFVKNEDGSYSSKSFWGARSQYLLAVAFTGSYRFQRENGPPPVLIFGFRSLLQGTFVASYVPLIPINSFQLGVRLPILKK